MGTELTAEEKKIRLGSFFRFILLITVPPLIIVPTVYVIFPDPTELQEVVRAAYSTDNMGRLIKVAGELIQQDPNEIRNHWRYIIAHFEGRDPDDVHPRLLRGYLKKSEEAELRQRDIGCFGAGVCYNEMEDYEKALEWLVKVQDPNLEYYN